MMQFSMTQIVIVVLMMVSIVTFAILTLSAAKRFLLRLETVDPKAWKELGKPSGGVLAPEYRMAFLSFLISNARRARNDEQLNQAGTSVLTFLFVMATDVMFIIAVLGFGLFR